MKFFKLFFLLPILFLTLFSTPIFAIGTGTDPGGSGSTEPTIIVKGPNGEPSNSLPSTQADSNVYYKVTVYGLSPRQSYHIKIFKAAGWDLPAIQNGTDPEGDLHLKPSGVESVCGATDDDGTVEVTYPDGNLPNGNDVIGDFIMEVATNSGNPSGDSCKRGTYVQSSHITIIETEKTYGGAGDSGQETEVKEPDPFPNLPTDPVEFASAVVRIAIGVAGGLAFLLMIFGAYKLIFSAGNPEALQQGRDTITAAIIGLVVILFSVFILRLIGIDILGLPI